MNGLGAECVQLWIYVTLSHLENIAMRIEITITTLGSRFEEMAY